MAATQNLVSVNYISTLLYILISCMVEKCATCCPSHDINFRHYYFLSALVVVYVLHKCKLLWAPKPIGGGLKVWFTQLKNVM